MISTVNNSRKRNNDEELEIETQSSGMLIFILCTTICISKVINVIYILLI